MLNKLFKWLISLLILAAAAWAALLFIPKTLPQDYRLKVNKNEGISAVGRQLAQDDAVYNRYVLLGTAYLMGIHNQLHAGNYRLAPQTSAWAILQRLKAGEPDSVTIRFTEGIRFSQMRNIINKTRDIKHETAGWSTEQLLHEIDTNAISTHPEGLFSPDSYDIDTGSSDLTVYRMAYRTMQKNLQEAWDDRKSDLPYQNPYELLIMASLIEKETSQPGDRKKVAAVFINRLAEGMRLQTDPTVIYGLGSSFTGKIRKSDLKHDTPYNTYTRNGMPPTPICLPSNAALEAAAHPSPEHYLYFVSKMDGTGESQFSTTLDEHNAAVRQYIKKQ